MKRSSSGLHALLAIDKPVGMTSHDVVNKLRRALHERRIGHAGTLDPDACGVLVVGVGQGTRLMGLLQSVSAIRHVSVLAHRPLRMMLQVKSLLRLRFLSSFMIQTLPRTPYSIL